MLSFLSLIDYRGKLQEKIKPILTNLTTGVKVDKVRIEEVV